VTLSRAASDTFAGIRPVDAPAFIAAQIVGALLAVAVMRWMRAKPVPDTTDKMLPPNPPG
jgi:hypothetical protein